MLSTVGSRAFPVAAAQLWNSLPHWAHFTVPIYCSFLLFIFVFLCLSSHTAYVLYYCNTVGGPGDNVETGLLQLSASQYTTGDDRTIATCAECRYSPDLQAGYSRACHGEPPSVALPDVGGSSSSCAVSCTQCFTESARTISPTS